MSCTDGSMICELCLEPKTRCNLCIRAPLIPTPAHIRKKWAEEEDRYVPLWSNIYYH